MYEEEMRRKVTGFVYEKQNKKKKAVICLTKTEAENKGGADANST